MEILCLQCRARLFPLFGRGSHGFKIIKSSSVHIRLYATLHQPPSVQPDSKPRPPKKRSLVLKEKKELNEVVFDEVLSNEPKRKDVQCKSLDEEWREQRIDIKKLPYMYLKLSKYRLTSLVVLTTLVGYAMAPSPTIPSVLLYSCVGTALCSAAANTFNQKVWPNIDHIFSNSWFEFWPVVIQQKLTFTWIEVPFDSQMSRTRNRVLVRGLMSPLHALSFGIISGLTGTLILATGVNALTATLGVFNIILYSAVYTPMKRLSIANTWVGSVVGAIPPVMGWTACTGTLSPSAFILAGVLFAWQFPHFNALSWSHQGDYSRGGYRMMSVTDPLLCRKVALRYSLSLIPICTAAPVFGLTTWWFAFDSALPNLWLSYLSWKFYQDSDFKSARRLFHFSLVHLPLLLGLMLLNKASWKTDGSPSSDKIKREHSE